MSAVILLKRDEIQQGKIYRCALSGNDVLVFRVEEIESTQRGNIVVDIYYWNKVKGSYDLSTAIDYQLYSVQEEFTFNSSLNTD